MSPKAFCLNVSSCIIGGDCTLCSCSPVSGSNGSTATLWRTSVIRLAVVSLISLWRIKGKPLVGQLRACSTLSGFPHRQCEGSCSTPNHTSDMQRPEWHSYAKYSHGPVSVRLLTRKKHLFQWKVQDTIDGNGMVVGIEYRPLAHFASF